MWDVFNMRLTGKSAGRVWIAAILAGAGVLIYADIRFLHAMRPDTTGHFDLSADDNGGTLVFGWNPAGPWLSYAENAELFIDDGPHHAQMLLLRGQIAGGSLQYTPFTKDVRFRLVAHARDGRSAQESIRILGPQFESADRVLPRHWTRTKDPGTVAIRIVANR